MAADFFNTIPQVYDQEERPPQPPWRLLLAEAEDKEKWAIISQEVLIQIEPFKDLMESIRIKLCRVRQAANSPDKMDPVLARSIIESAYLAIEKNMLNAIPWPEVAPPGSERIVSLARVSTPFTRY